MILADKIIKLRKQFAWSQEELAEKMNVSRQSVSKWESANSIPDLNKIIMLTEIFGVSTDYLVKDEIEEAESISEDKEPGVATISLEEAKNYVDNKMKVSKYIARGVLLCLYAVIPLLFLLGIADGKVTKLTSNTAAAIGLTLLFLMIAMGVGFFLRISQYDSEFARLEKERFELVYGVKSIFKEKSKEYRPIYNQKLTIGISMFILSVVPLLLVSILGGSGMMALMMVVLLILIIGAGIYYILPSTTRYGAYNCIISEGDYAPDKKKETSRIEKIAALYWPLMVAIYIGWSFWTMAWGVTWIIWPIATVAFVPLIGLIGLFASDD